MKCVRQLKPVVDGQQVKVTIHIPAKERHPMFKYFALSMFKILRCSDFSITGIPDRSNLDTDWAYYFPSVPVLRNIQQTVTSNTPVLDLMQKADHCIEYLERLSDDTKRNLKRAAKAFDEAGFLREYEKAVQEFDEVYMRRRRQKDADFMGRRKFILNMVGNKGFVNIRKPDGMRKDEAILFEN